MSDREFSGNAAATTLATQVSAGATSINLTAATGWPTGTGSNTFVVVIGRGLPEEEKILCDSRASTVLTVASGGRGYDGTTDQTHASGTVIEHCVDAVWLQEVNEHLNDATGAHLASEITNTPAGSIAATTVQAAINELDSEKAAAAEPVAAAHIVDATAAHAASAVSFSPAGTIAGTDVQAAVAEVATDAATALTTHEADTTSVHGIANTANVVLNTRQVISGNGLTGGGALSGDLTLAVGAGTGISVAADAVAVDSSLVTLGAWTAWTPTLRQGASDLSITVNMGSYARFGRLIVAQAAISINALGTAFNVLKVSWPVAPKTVGSTSPAFGSAYFHHHSFQKHSLAVIWESATYMAFIGGGTNTEPSTPFLGSFGIDYVQVSSGDIIGIQLCYEAAS